MPRPPSPASALPLALLVLAGVGRPARAYTPAEAKAPMTVTLVRSDAAGCGAGCPGWLALTGKIGFETPGRLAAVLARLGKRRVPVVLDSPGGESLAGLAMGRMIRAHGLDTVVATTTLVPCATADAPCRAREGAGERDGHVSPDWGVVHLPICASACVLALAGGVDRAVPPDAFVGVHQAKRVLTFHPVMNTFRVLSRIVNGRKVEVGRTLVATHALPVRVVTEAAPQSVYDQFERTLIGLGIDESIVPLMRATPPSGIHWMTAAELASTRIANDTADAEAFVKREAEAQAATRRETRLLAALTLRDARRWRGGVTWRVDATTPGAPALVGDRTVPDRRLRGSVTIKADEAPNAAASFRIVTRFASDGGPDADRVLTVQTPEICDLAKCVLVIAGDTVFDRPSASFDVGKVWRAAFLGDLRQLAWLRIFVRTDEGNGSIDLSLSSPGSSAIADWEKLCCAFEAIAAAEPPATDLPAFIDHPEPSLVKDLRPVQPLAAGAKPPPRVLDMLALFDAAPMQEHGFPAAVHGSMAWFPLAAPATVGDAGTAALLGTAELPAAGLRVSIEAGASRPGVLGRLTVKLGILTGDPSTFGPMKRIFALNTYDAQSHPLLLVDTVSADNEIHLDIPGTGPIAGAFQVGFEDVRGRRITLAFPFDPAVAGLLQAASRRGPAGGS